MVVVVQGVCRMCPRACAARQSSVQADEPRQSRVSRLRMLLIRLTVEAPRGAGAPRSCYARRGVSRASPAVREMSPPANALVRCRTARVERWGVKEFGSCANEVVAGRARVVCRVYA